jgi:preprotein translocase subunit YajC
MGGLGLIVVIVATFALAAFLIVRNKATEQETLDMLYDDDIWP